MEINSVVDDDIIGRTVGNLHLLCHFMNSHPSGENQRADLFSVPLVINVDGYSDRSSSLTFVRPLLNIPVH